ncbi:MAG TPA: outer membrane beta-barrel protein [Bryobacteraceae bacterium]|nr:outer membrane beta-barrel protein [Bryobacteraceae bacterium]
MKGTEAIAVVAMLMAAPGALAQRHEIGLTLGAISGADRNTSSGQLGLGTGVALQANYGYRIFASRHAALFAEVHFLANPLRDITSMDGRASRDVATLYVLPGLRIKFLPARSFSPYVAVGGGYALYEQSLTQIDGSPNPAPRNTHRGALGFGGGADFPVWRFVGGRIEIRDFYTGNPSFNIPVSGGGQHNVVAGGGVVLRLGSSEK